VWFLQVGVVSERVLPEVADVVCRGFALNGDVVAAKQTINLSVNEGVAVQPRHPWNYK